MQRRDFLSASLAASAAALAPSALAAAPASGRQYYELRTYTLSSGPYQGKTLDNYLSQALIPALGRIGIGPVGAFRLTYGPETPQLYLLLPCNSLETLITAGEKLALDPEYLKAATAFNNISAPPVFHRVESSLLHAFEGFPTLHVPAKQTPRIVHLRTYESPNQEAHERKVEMFHHGEFEIFKRSGCESIFYSQTIIGPRMPSLTYMLGFKDLAALDAGWAAFLSDPEWKKLRDSPRYATDTIVGNITNLVLTPTAYSQV